MKKNIIFDITHYCRKSWFWRVTKEIIDRFISNYKDEFNIILVWNNLWIKQIKWIDVIDIKSNYIIFKFFKLNQVLKKYKWWIFFSFDNIFFWKIKWYKYITIIHDLWYEHSWEKDKFNYIKKIDLKRCFFYGLNFTLKNFTLANKIIVPSEYTKKDLIDFYKLDKYQTNKIEVIKWWVDHFKKDDNINKNWNLWILIPFPLLSDKNLNELSNILNNLHIKDITQITFIWIRWKQKDKLIKKLKNLNIIKFEEKFIDDKKLIDYFNKKNVCIYITHFDGFWFWPLECQYFWNPVISSYSTSIPYILWNSVEYIKEKNNMKEIIGKINYVIKNYDLYSRKSIENSNKYKWWITVNKVYDTIKKI